ncbi:MAG: GGDEF domain-containing response regulator [Proteobacteria bacterium]|nr:GGDEF domain-containing response regulator [Pseudomonadota bacterium]MBU1647883.1 GGDEF domain-containing response regulator [Pseudomonadota bacterium]
MSDHKFCFLIIDDDPGDIEILRRTIEAIPDLQADIISLSTCFLETADQVCHQADLIFIDYRLGNDTGLDIFQLMIEKGCTKPMIMLTGQGNELVAVEAMKSGFSDYLVKGTIEPDSLHRAIRNSLQRANLTQQIAEQQKRLEELARIDELTGLHNRRFFIEQLNMEVNRSKRSGQHLSILMLDLDHFKLINDTHGHQTGDRVLARTGEVIRRHIRETDIVGRIGGEEFAFGLNNSGLPGAYIFAERIRKALAAECFITSDKNMFMVTCSIGIYSVNKDIPDAIAALNSADKALYKAKDLGRNRVFPLPQVKELP